MNDPSLYFPSLIGKKESTIPAFTFGNSSHTMVKEGVVEPLGENFGRPHFEAGRLLYSNPVNFVSYVTAAVIVTLMMKIDFSLF